MPSGIPSEAVPLREEIVAAVIADLVEHAAVHVAGLAHVRRIDDDFAAVGDGRLRLVDALGGRPQILVHRRHHRQHAIEGLVEPDDVAPAESAAACRHASWLPVASPQ